MQKLLKLFLAVLFICGLTIQANASAPFQYKPQAVCAVPVSSQPSQPFFYCGPPQATPSPGGLPTATASPSPSPSPSSTATSTASPFPSPSSSATATPTTTPVPTLDETWLTYTQNTPWANGSVHTNWITQFLDISGGSSTNASLLTSNSLFGDFDVTFQNIKTVSQTAGSPAATDRAWVIWHWLTNVRGYAFVMETTGWKLVKINSSTSTTTLTSGTTPTYPLNVGPVNVAHTVRVTQTANAIHVFVDGTSITTYTDTSSQPYLNGAFGLATVNAHSEFGKVFAPTSSFSLSRKSIAFSKEVPDLDEKTVTAFPIFAYKNPTGVQHTIDKVYFAANLPSPAPSGSPMLVCSTPDKANNVKLLQFCPSAYPVPSSTPH